MVTLDAIAPDGVFRCVASPCGFFGRDARMGSVRPQVSRGSSLLHGRYSQTHSRLDAWLSDERNDSFEAVDADYRIVGGLGACRNPDGMGRLVA